MNDEKNPNEGTKGGEWQNRHPKNVDTDADYKVEPSINNNKQGPPYCVRNFYFVCC